MMMLKTLGQTHRYVIAGWIQQISDDERQLEGDPLSCIVTDAFKRVDHRRTACCRRQSAHTALPAYAPRPEENGIALFHERRPLCLFDISS